MERAHECAICVFWSWVMGQWLPCWPLADAGHEVIGPMTSAEEAIKLAHENKPQFAFLDVNRRGSDSGRSIIHCFDELGIPTMFLIGSLGSNEQREAAAGLLSDPHYLDFLLAVVEYIRTKGRSMLPEFPSCFLPDI